MFGEEEHSGAYSNEQHVNDTLSYLVRSSAGRHKETRFLFVTKFRTLRAAATGCVTMYEKIIVIVIDREVKIALDILELNLVFAFFFKKLARKIIEDG